MYVYEHFNGVKFKMEQISNALSMMSVTDGHVLLAAARWTDEGQYLREFVAKNRLPAVVKVIKGQYGGIGVPSLPNPCVQSTMMLVSAGRRRKILSQMIKIKEGRRIVDVGPKFVIPDTYQGYFELLSEDGRTMKCLESVAELAHRKSNCGYLVRDSIRAIVGNYDVDGNLTADGSRIVNAGETLFSEIEVQLGSSKSKFLRCVDSMGEIVLLSLDQKGRFSVLAKEDNISGVHTAKNLLQKRLPVTVRLVHGTPPKGLKNLNHFVPEMRLLCAFEEEQIFAIPLQKEAGAVVSLPLAAPIKLLRARNEDCLKETREYQRLVDRCTKLGDENVNRAYVLDGKCVDLKSPKGASNGLRSMNAYLLSRSVSADTNYAYEIENRPLNTEYDEIDLIYDYVRGFAPLPKNLRTSPFGGESETKGHQHQHQQQERRDADVAAIVDKCIKPEPPPIETIPKAKIVLISKAEKRAHRLAREPEECVDRSAYSKLYVKNGLSQNRRLLRQKSSSPLKEHPPLLKSYSPIFNIRYKSLNNLQQAMELDGTLNSSTSGGKTSADSATGTKLPEKRSKRISRPRSLTNLVWEFHHDVESRSDSRKPRPAKIEAPALRRNSSTQKSSLYSQKRIGTLYL